MARLLAPLLVGYAAIRGLVAVFQQQWQLLVLRLTARRHVVIAGLGSTGFRLADALAQAGHQVVVIEQVADHPSLASCQQRGIPVVIGDATDVEVQAKARTDRAAHLFVCCGHDASNLQVLGATAQLAQDPGWQPTHVHVFVQDAGLWGALRRSVLLGDRPSSLRADFISLPDLAARAFIDAGPDWHSGAPDHVHLVADAPTALGRRALIYALRKAARGRSDHVQLTFCGIDALAQRAQLVQDAPGLLKDMTVDVWEADATTAVDAPSFGDVTVMIVCQSDEARGLAVADALVRLTPQLQTPVVVAVNDDRVGRSLIEADLTFARVHVLGSTGQVLGGDLLEDTSIEAIARAKHADYVRLALQRGERPEDNPSLVSWEQLPDSLKESNRSFADGVGVKLRELGAEVIAAEVGGRTAPAAALPQTVVEQLAETEHDRWMTALLAQGWRPTEGAKDAVRKLHPLLVGWEDLPDVEREKDRDPIRALPELLDAAGYALRFPAANSD